jgi:hypothetical protein
VTVQSYVNICFHCFVLKSLVVVSSILVSCDKIHVRVLMAYFLGL